MNAERISSIIICVILSFGMNDLSLAGLSETNMASSLVQEAGLLKTQNSACTAPTFFAEVWWESETEYRYDEQCNILFRRNSNTVLKMEYEPIFNRLSLFEKYTTNNKLQRSTSYEYSAGGYLIQAQTNDGWVLYVKYNDLNLVSQIIDHEGNALGFKYDKNNNLVQTSLAGVDVNISRDKLGRIESVTSEHDLTSIQNVVKLHGTFHNIIRPAF
jgi:hypothetical protein